MPPKYRNRKCSFKDSKCGEGGAGKLRNIFKTKCGGDDLKMEVRNRSQRNIVNNLEGVERGCKATNLLRKAGRDVLIKNISLFSLYKSISPFDRRITFIEWHPKYPEIIAAASKGGDILLWNYGTSAALQLMIRGKGAGGSVQGIKFHLQKEMEIYTTAIDGTVCAWNYLHKTCKILLQTNDYNKWYTGLDVCRSSGHLVAGDNFGFLTVLSPDGQKMWEARLHKNKITHAEYHPR